MLAYQFPNPIKHITIVDKNSHSIHGKLGRKTKSPEGLFVAYQRRNTNKEVLFECYSNHFRKSRMLIHMIICLNQPVFFQKDKDGAAAFITKRKFLKKTAGADGHVVVPRHFFLADIAFHYKHSGG